MRLFSLNVALLSLVSVTVTVAQETTTADRPEGSLFDAAEQTIPFRAAERLPEEPLFGDRESYGQGPSEYTPVTPEPTAEPFPIQRPLPTYTPEPYSQRSSSQPPITSQQRRIIAREAARAKQRRAILESRKRIGYSPLRPNLSYPPNRYEYPAWHYWNTLRVVPGRYWVR